MNQKVLLVDDDSNILASYGRQLRKRFAFLTAESGAQALDLAKTEGPFAVVVSDMRMPAMNGIELLQRFAELSPDTVRIMLTGNADQHTAVSAVNDGRIFRFLNKPCPPETLAAAIDAGLAQYDLVTAERDLLEKTLAGSVKVLVDVLSLVDPQSFSQAKTLREITREIATVLGLTNLWQLDMAAMLSPIGRITLPPEVTNKLQRGSPLDSNERAMVARIPEIGRDLIANIPRLKEVSEIIYYQGKAFDGSGFPDRPVAGNDIPLGARILHAASALIMAGGDMPRSRTAILHLEGEAHLYDAAVLAAIKELYLDEADDQRSAEGAAESLRLAFAQLRAGDKLISNITTESNHLILAAGQELTQPLIEKLRNLNAVRRLKEPIYVSRCMPQEDVPVPAAAASR